MTEKATAEEIQRRFDADVESFSNLETGQTAIIDAPLMLELVSACSAAVTPQATSMLDIGCGAGNYALKVLGELPTLDVTLLDLSGAMLERAQERVAEATSGTMSTLQGDIREVELGEGAYDIITAAASLHHLRADDEWHHVFKKCFRALRPGGALWIADVVEQVHPAIQALIWERYGDYLVKLGGVEHRDHAFKQVELNDTPRSLEFQTAALYGAGFSHVDIVHKNGPFAAFAALK
jgi:tRNA (cmo5U34)-methyltransferase